MVAVRASAPMRTAPLSFGRRAGACVRLLAFSPSPSAAPAPPVGDEVHFGIVIVVVVVVVALVG